MNVPRRLAALALVVLAGCKTPHPTPVIPDVVRTDGTSAGVFDVTQIALDNGRVVAHVQKTAEAPGLYPVLFFRCLDSDGTTIAVIAEEEKRFAYEGRGVRYRIACELPQRTEEVEMTLRGDGGPNVGAPR